MRTFFNRIKTYVYNLIYKEKDQRIERLESLLENLLCSVFDDTGMAFNEDCTVVFIDGFGEMDVGTSEHVKELVQTIYSLETEIENLKSEINKKDLKIAMRKSMRKKR